MKKNLLLPILIISILSACNPDDDNTPPPNPTSLPSWQSIGELYLQATGGGYGEVLCWEIYNGELYIGGLFNAVNGIVANGLAKWDGINWSAVPGSAIENSPTEYVIAMVVYNGELYVKYRDQSIPQKYDGSNWTNVAAIDNFLGSGYPDDMVVFNGLLYNANTIYDGTSADTIVPLINPLDTLSTTPYSYSVYNNKLYCSGKFRSSSNFNFWGLYKWENNEWKRATGQTISEPEIYSMAVFNNELYVAGTFTSIGGLQTNRLAKYNGTSWQAINGITCDFSAWLYADNSHIYFSPANNGVIGGGFNFTNNPDSAFSNIARFDGNNWEYVSDSAHSKSIFGKIIMYNSYLYAQTENENSIRRIVRIQPQ